MLGNLSRFVVDLGFFAASVASQLVAVEAVVAADLNLVSSTFASQCARFDAIFVTPISSSKYFALSLTNSST